MPVTADFSLTVRWIPRDVFDFNVDETAEILQLSEPNVKTTHHRARRVMREYEEKRFVPHKSLVEKTGQVVAQLVEFLTKRDTEGAAKLLAANVVCLSDGGGEVFAARVPVVGRSKVSLFLSKLLNATSAFASRTRAVELNGLFAMATERDDAPPGYAKKLATLFQINDEGRISRIYFCDGFAQAGGSARSKARLKKQHMSLAVLTKLPHVAKNTKRRWPVLRLLPENAAI